jgi:hypothetical protein
MNTLNPRVKISGFVAAVPARVPLVNVDRVAGTSTTDAIK